MTATTKAPIGRPSMKDTKIASYDSELYKLLQTKLAQFVERDRLNVRKLAAAIGVSPAAVYRWLQSNRITSHGAQLIIDSSEEKLTTKDLADFLIAS